MADAVQTVSNATTQKTTPVRPYLCFEVELAEESPVSRAPRVVAWAAGIALEPFFRSAAFIRCGVGVGGN